MYRIFNVMDDNAHVYYGEKSPFVFDTMGNIFIVTSRQGDEELELRKLNKNIILQIKQDNDVWVNVTPIKE